MFQYQIVVIDFIRVEQFFENMVEVEGEVVEPVPEAGSAVAALASSVVLVVVAQFQIPVIRNGCL